MRRYLVLLFIVFGVIVTMAGCGNSYEMEDGFYTAEMSELSFGWREYLCIMVKNNKIVYAEYNAKNTSGLVKSWDNNYMENMYVPCGTYPNDYTRKYVSQFLEGQSGENVELISGATGSYDNFQKLSVAVIERARKGDHEIIRVE